MNFRRLALFASVVFAGVFLFAHLAANNQNSPVFAGQISKDSFVIVEGTKASFLSISGILNGVSNLIDNAETKKPTDTSFKNACINNKDPKALSPKEQLLEFIQGPCQPVILIPGLLASKLSVKINCEELRTKNPEIFKSCGWDTCSSTSILANKPQSEYTVWISSLVGPLSLALDKTAQCWGNIMQLEYNAHETDVKNRYKSPAGIDIVVFADKATANNTEENCGFSGTNNILDGGIQLDKTRGYLAMKDALVSMGYQVGLTLYGAPYDWRKTTVANGIGKTLNDTIKQIHSLTGKQTIIVGHSLGNFGALYVLNSLSQEEKDKYIANYVSLMNPLSGSPKAVLAYVGGDSEYFYADKYGMGFAAQKKLFESSSGSFDVLTKDPFTEFAGEEWMKEWQARINLEKTYNVSFTAGKSKWNELVKSGNYPFKWFPTPLQQCFSGFLNRPNECALFMYDWSKEPIAQIVDEKFNANQKDLNKLFKDYVRTTTRSDDLFKDARTNNIFKLENPGVPVTLVYGSHMPTMKSFSWSYDPRNNTEHNKFAPPSKITYALGDKTVPTASSLLPAFKWSWEFDNKQKAGLPHAKPVKTIEVCSNYNNKLSIYDKKVSTEPYQVLENEYIGLECDCVVKDKIVPGDSCAHSPILTDSGLIKLVKNIAYANVKNSNYKETMAYKLSEAQLKNLANQCPTVSTGAKGYNDIILTTFNVNVKAQAVVV